MSNNLQVFKNSAFVEIRIIELNEESWFVVKLNMLSELKKLYK